MVSAVASHQEGPGFHSGSECFCVEFVCSPCACVCSLRVLWLPPTFQKHANWGLVGQLITLNVIVDGGLSLYVSSVMNQWVVQGDPRLPLKILRWTPVEDRIIFQYIQWLAKVFIL